MDLQFLQFSFTLGFGFGVFFPLFSQKNFVPWGPLVKMASVPKDLNPPVVLWSVMSELPPKARCPLFYLVKLIICVHGLGTII